MKKTYKLLTDDALAFANEQRDPASEDPPFAVGDKQEIELSAQQEKAMIAAGWIEGPIEGKGGKG